MINLTNQQIEKINQHTLEAFPNEACGVITAFDYIPLTNVAQEPISSFEIKKEEYNQIQQEYEILAIFHSHTRVPGMEYHQVRNYDPRTPSPRDVKSSRALGLPFLIAATDGEIVVPCIEYPGDPNADLYNRQFIFYINDCYTLVRDYLFQNYDILLPGHHDTFDWINNGQGIVYPYYDAYFEEWGFKEISEDELEVGDVVIMSFNGPANHLGVYVGDYQVLHHIVNQPPMTYSLSRIKSYIHRYIRHKDKYLKQSNKE